MIKCCLFDLDGTLLNTLDTITHYVNRSLSSDGLEPISSDECRGFIGDGALNLLTRAYAHRGVTDPEVARSRLASYVAGYDEDPYYLTEPYPGIPELLCELVSRGVRIGILSNKQDSSVSMIVDRFFPGLVHGCMGGRLGVPLKPSPVSSLELLSRLGHRPEDTVFIGDSDVDMLTGRALGSRCIGVSWGYRPEALRATDSDGVADTAEELLRLIERCGE